MENFIQLIKNMGPFKIIGIVSGFMLMLFIGIIIVMKSTSHNFVPLYGNLDLKDSNKIVSELESQNIPYKLKAEGTQILVPDTMVLKIRMNMAKSGIPSKGSLVGYEIFDNTDGLGTSNFVQNVNLLRALEGELARTISTFSNIESARIHLVMPKKELFSREKQTPSASVVLSMKGSKILSKDQINAIGHLVATSVGGLELSRITIVDTNGRSLKLGAKDENDPSFISSINEDLRISYENRLKNVIEELLEQSIGVGHVKAQVSADMNFDRVVTNYEIFDPAGQVIRSTQEVNDKTSSSENKKDDNVSVTSIPTDQNLPTSSSSTEHSDTTTNYEISKTVKNHISETGVIKKISIAVLVDGTYITDQKTGEISYKPRSEDDLKKYESLVKTAVGFDESRNDKIEILNMQFITDLSSLAQETTITWLKRELPSILQTLVIGVVVIFVLLLVIRPIALRAFEVTHSEEQTEEADLVETQQAIMNNQVDINSEDKEQQSVFKEPLIDIAKIDAKVRSNLAYKSVNEIVSKYPQETITTLRKWLSQD